MVCRPNGVQKVLVVPNGKVPGRGGEKTNIGTVKKIKGSVFDVTAFVSIPLSRLLKLFDIIVKRTSVRVVVVKRVNTFVLGMIQGF